MASSKHLDVIVFKNPIPCNLLGGDVLTLEAIKEAVVQMKSPRSAILDHVPVTLEFNPNRVLGSAKFFNEGDCIKADISIELVKGADYKTKKLIPALKVKFDEYGDKLQIVGVGLCGSANLDKEIPSVNFNIPK